MSSRTPRGPVARVHDNTAIIVVKKVERATRFDRGRESKTRRRKGYTKGRVVVMKKGAILTFVGRVLHPSFQLWAPNHNSANIVCAMAIPQHERG